MNLVADTSFLINVLASGHAPTLIGLWDVTLILTETVDAEVKRNRTQLDELYVRGLAKMEALADGAASIFILAAAEVDDGEASAIALAAFKRWPIATDDARAQSIWLDLAGPDAEPARHTCGMLQDVALNLGPQALREILVAIQTVGRFDPPRGHAQWWARALDETGGG